MREIALDEAAAAVERRARIIDVREPAEYLARHLPGAVNIPMGQLPARLDELDRGAPVYVVCASGNRSSAMVEVLAAAGFDAINVAGGTSAWVGSGRPVER